MNRRITLLFAISLLLITTGACRLAELSPPQSRILHSNPNYLVKTDSVIQGKRMAVALNDSTLITEDSSRMVLQPAANMPHLNTTSPLLDVLYRIACRDLKGLYRQEGFFVAGMSGFFNRKHIFTRDIAYSSHLGLAYLMPEEVVTHLQTTRQLRLDIGYLHPIDHAVPLEGIRNELEEITNRQFFKKYGTNSYIRRTDDIVWVLGWYEAWLAQRDNEMLSEMIQQFETFDETFYRHFHDPDDGLYRGQSSWQDIGGAAYPDGFNYQQSVMIKPLSTNALFVAAFDRLARAAEILGLQQKKQQYQNRAEKLRTAIHNELRHPDGYYAFFKYPDGRLEPRKEQLGSAFIKLFEVVPESEQCQNAAGYKRNDFGAPTLFPFYEGRGTGYHHKVIWPFADMFLNQARFECATGSRKDAVLRQSLGSICRHALKGNFNEFMIYEEGKIVGSPSYIWSTSAYLSVLFDMLMGIETSPQGIRLNPHIPEELDGGISLTDLRIGKMNLNIRIEGYGKKVQTLKLDGQELDREWLEISEGDHQLVVQMKEGGS